jgi:replicative DNA helicase
VDINNIELEKELLNHLLIFEDRRAYAFANVAPEDFCDLTNSRMFEKIRDSFLTGNDFSTADLIDKEHSATYLNSLLDIFQYRYSTVQAVCASIINNAYVRKYRMAAKQVEHIIQEGNNFKSGDVISEIERTFLTALEKRNHSLTVKYSSAIAGGVARMDTALKGKTGLKTGYKSLDKIIIGIEPDNLVIIAARPSMGKSMFVQSIVNQTAKTGVPVLVVSLEMSAAQIALREMSAQSGVSYTRIRNGWLTEDETSRVIAAGDLLEKLPIHIDESSKCSIEKLYAKCRIMKQRDNIGMIVIDHNGLMESEGKANGRYEEMNRISAGLKRIAKDLKTPVLALHQLSRKNEDRADKTPRMSDLRDSGNIEQDADIVILLNREDYYDQDTTRKGIMDVIVAKGRDCGTGKTELIFRPELMIYQDIAPHGENF